MRHNIRMPNARIVPLRPQDAEIGERLARAQRDLAFLAERADELARAHPYAWIAILDGEILEINESADELYENLRRRRADIGQATIMQLLPDEAVLIL
jgi:hypothetical protein